ncbi:MAG: enoyl-CoA hydratase-related protein [Chloroflexota bacterium]
MPKYEVVYDPEMAPKDLKHVIYEKKGHIAYVTLNRPEVSNAMHTYLYMELRSIWRDISVDPNIYVGIVTGAGKVFSAGRDVKFLGEFQKQGKRTPHEDPTSPLYQWGGGGFPNDLMKPLIAALNGYAVGVAMGLVFQCQLRVMAEDAWLGDLHTNIGRVGNPQNYYLAMPRAVAAYMTLCNGRLTAQECLQYGIVNKVVPREKLMETAEEMANMVCRSSPLAVQAAVQLYKLAAQTDPSLAELARIFDKMAGESDDCVEGVKAINEKRRPVWKSQWPWPR